ncbi:MAG: ABC transporter ATP-binding protein [Candidatus Thermoplasmatota archaeon]|nr:ABC transporter ATP-binding protein [Candidatus Thermoplasmatota archaeon]
MAVPLVSTALRMTYKSKGKTSPAIKNFSFSVKDNSIFSILGRNGSGKTTFVKISTTQLRPDSGSVEIFGHDVIEEDQEVRKIISLVPQESRPFPFLTPWEHVYYFQKMNGNTREGSKERAQFVMDLLDMGSYCDTECVNLSGDGTEAVDHGCNGSFPGFSDIFSGRTYHRA